MLTRILTIDIISFERSARCLQYHLVAVVQAEELQIIARKRVACITSRHAQCYVCQFGSPSLG